MRQSLVLDQRTQDLSDDLMCKICSKTGVIRLTYVRDLIGKLTQDNLDLQMDVFLKWMLTDESLILEGTHWKSGKNKKIVTKCSKRGNDVYNKRLLDRFRFLERLPKKDFFSLSDFLTDDKVQTTIEHDFIGMKDFTTDKKVYGKALWWTLTFDSKLMSLDDAWKSISSQYNLWITNLRNKYGRIHALKFFQASPRKKGLAYGYVHVHVVLLFEDSKFEVFPNWETNKRTGVSDYVFRVHERDELKAQGKWHSISDIKAIKSVSAVVNYCTKHSNGTYQVINNDGEINHEALLNSATTWYYKKRAFSVSGEFSQKLSEFIHYMRNSKVFQSRIDGGDPIPVWTWKCFGVRSYSELRKAGLEPVKWVNRIDDPEVWNKIICQRENY